LKLSIYPYIQKEQSHVRNCWYVGQGNQWVGSQQIKWMWIKRLRGSQQLGLEATASVPSNPSSAIFKDELQPMPLFSQHHVCFCKVHVDGDALLQLYFTCLRIWLAAPWIP
jgi:hypothetical protein